MRFSNPVSFWCENGKLSGSAQTRSSAPSAQLQKKNRLRQRENMEHAAFDGVLRQVAHGVGEAQADGAVPRVHFLGDRDAGPAADAGENGDVLLAVGAAEGDRLADDSGAGLELPQELAALRVERLEE